jgi:hypothetical protein
MEKTGLNGKSPATVPSKTSQYGSKEHLAGKKYI